MLKLCRVFERRHVPVQVPQPFVQRRIPRANIANIALEVLHVYRIESSNSRVQTHI